LGWGLVPRITAAFFKNVVLLPEDGVLAPQQAQVIRFRPPVQDPRCFAASLPSLRRQSPVVEQIAYAAMYALYAPAWLVVAD
jgi:hypothetical protein